MEFKLHSDKATNSVRQMLAARSRSSVGALATELDMKDTTLRAAITNESLRLKDFLRIAERLGFSVIVKDNEQ